MMNTPPMEIYWIGLIGILATMLIDLARPGWRIGSQLARNSYVLVSCVVAVVICGMPRTGLRADEGAEIRTGQTNGDNSSVHAEDPRAAVPRPPVPVTASDKLSIETTSLVGNASKSFQHPDPRQAELRPPTPEESLSSSQADSTTISQLATDKRQDRPQVSETWADPRQAVPHPPIPASSSGLASTPPPTEGEVDQANDPRAALPQPPVPSAELANAGGAPASSGQFIDVPAEVVDLEAEQAALSRVASETGEDGADEDTAGSENDTNDIASDIDSLNPNIVPNRIGEHSEPQLDVGAIMSSHSSGPVPLAVGHGYRVVAGPYSREDGGKRELDDEMDRAITTFIEGHVGRNGVADRLGFDTHYARRYLLIGSPEEEIKHETLPATRYMTAVLRFDQDFKDEINSRWTTVVREARLRQVSWASGGVLALLATVFSYLRLDTATRGFYTGRLRVATAGAILALAALGVLLARWIPWI